jgi:hypothetical protein
MVERQLFGHLHDKSIQAPFNFYELKDQARKNLLEVRQDLHRRVDTSRLRKIIDYSAFKCDPLSSVARNVAIVGSDINAGLVVLHEETPVETQMEFIGELRAQGFEVYHGIEALEYRKRYNDAPSSLDWIDRLDLLCQATAAESNQIDFIEESILLARGSELGTVYQKYISGFTIGAEDTIS